MGSWLTGSGQRKENYLCPSGGIGRRKIGQLHLVARHCLYLRLETEEGETRIAGSSPALDKGEKHKMSEFEKWCTIGVPEEIDEPDECVLDSGQLHHCIHAQRIIKEHANENAPECKKYCEHWKPGFVDPSKKDDEAQIAELVHIVESLLEYINAIPKETANAFPVMPGIDRDWVESIIAKAKITRKNNKIYTK